MDVGDGISGETGYAGFTRNPIFHFSRPTSQTGFTPKIGSPALPFREDSALTEQSFVHRLS